MKPISGNQNLTISRDKIITTIPDAIDTITHLAPLECSDHDTYTVVELFVFVPASPT